jgi:serine/threonine-protein kinase
MTARYTITAALGRTAYRATMTMTAADAAAPAREVAILRAPEPEGVRYFRVDLRAAIGIRHANLVELIDITYTAADEGRDEAAYFITEHVDGCDLVALVAGQPRLASEHALHVVIGCCRGLAHAHSLGFVHGQVWPGAVLLSTAGEVKLADLGIASLRRRNRSTVTRPGDRAYLGYISPEMIVGTGFDHRADVFAAGVVLWELLAGRALFRGATEIDTVRQVHDAVVPRIDGLDPALDTIVRRALARHPAERFATAGELGDALASCGIAAAPPDVPPRCPSAGGADLARAQWEIDQIVSILRE